MEPKSPIKRPELMETLLPAFLHPLDADDCFELASEADEFGVHPPEQPDHG